MKAGFIGLGRMGAGMVQRLIKGGHEIVAYARTPESIKKVVEKGAEGAYSLNELVERLDTPRIIWLMVPAGKITGEVINQVSSLMEKGDIIIDGGNSYYKDSIKRAEDLKEKGISLLDIGTSGGVWGLEQGYCLMAGGEKAVFDRVEPLLKTLAPEAGYAYVGRSGAGHFVKMIHNGIEYAMLQAYGEGFEVMHSKKDLDLDLHRIAVLWNHGSVIRSWILELAEDVFKKDKNLDSIKGYVEDSGEGRWTVQEAIEENVPAPIITLSLLQRFRSRQEDSFSAKVIAALRNEFGGHPVKKKD
jgi:6-phosphogluconate dehydrogenase